MTQLFIHFYQLPFWLDNDISSTSKHPRFITNFFNKLLRNLLSQFFIYLFSSSVFFFLQCFTLVKVGRTIKRCGNNSPVTLVPAEFLIVPNLIEKYFLNVLLKTNNITFIQFAQSEFTLEEVYATNKSFIIIFCIKKGCRYLLITYLRFFSRGGKDQLSYLIS